MCRCPSEWNLRAIRPMSSNRRDRVQRAMSWRRRRTDHKTGNERRRRRDWSNRCASCFGARVVGVKSTVSPPPAADGGRPEPNNAAPAFRPPTATGRRHRFARRRAVVTTVVVRRRRTHILVRTVCLPVARPRVNRHAVFTIILSLGKCRRYAVDELPPKLDKSRNIRVPT